VFDFVGPAYGAEKEKLFSEADLFVLPTYSENFGHVVAEALVRGIPVITTHGAPWRELDETRSGWWVEMGAEPLAGALASALALRDSERDEMGLRGRAMIIERYSWSTTAAKYFQLYRWAAGLAERPPFVRTPA
jgi:glycosyltransferase involved in cell wall biosynthesis